MAGFLRNKISSFSLTIFLLGIGASASHAREWDSESSRMEVFDCQKNLPLFKYQSSAEFRVENSYLAMVASWLGHQRPEIMTSQLGDWGFDKISFFTPDGAGPTGYIARREKLLLLSFRGTESISDYVHNTSFMQTDLQSIGFPGHGHLGMARKFSKLKPEILDKAAQFITPGDEIVIVGHSLGGVMAMLASLSLEQHGYAVHLLQTFGQPHFGNAEFNDYANGILQSVYHRVEHEADITPHVPPLNSSAGAFASILPQKTKKLRDSIERVIGRLGFTPTPGNMRHLDDKNGLKLTDEGMEANFDNSYWIDVAKVLQNRKIDPDWITKTIKNFEDHKPNRYICSLASAINRQH